MTPTFDVSVMIKKDGTRWVRLITRETTLTPWDAMRLAENLRDHARSALGMEPLCWEAR